ncbi:MAG: acetyl-CoA synthetase [Actinomycetota bacterium]|jgi:acetyl-CoA synthetase|nr:acetyl-CoA synthetase [Actinomycetota bacterium]
MSGAMTEPVWFPSEPARTNVGRFMAVEGIGSFDELRRRSIDEPEWFWDETVRFLGLPFSTPYTQVLDDSAGIPWATWFIGGKLNLASACVDRWAEATPEKPAVVWEGEEGEVRRWTYAELRRRVDALAHQLQGEGIGDGDGVGIYLPMVPETVAAVLAVAKLGAVFLPLFSGYGADAIVSRLDDAEAKGLIYADVTLRRGKKVDMAAVAEEALGKLPAVTARIVIPRDGGDRSDDGATPFEACPVDSEHPLFIAYTSGTTGRPKGSVHVHGGWLAKVAEEGAFQTDCRADDTLFWFTDMGWIMGPWEVTAALAAGATLALFEGAPDWPEPDRLWAFVERHRVTILGISPTLIRALMPHGDGPVKAHDLSALRILGSTGEPWNEGPWRWYFEVVGGGRCPVINISGGTEVGACFLSPHPVEPLKPMSLGGPSLGMAVDVYDDEGKPLREAVGELVCTKPWPGMTRGLYKDPDRYIETYWSRWPDVWVHGDWASIDEDGDWFLHGRSDDTIKVAGKRLGPAEAESALVSHPAVIEAAAVGIPDEVKGEVLWGYVVLAPGTEETEQLRKELADLVAEQLGKSFRPSAVKFTDALPKTRNAKVLRRAVRAVATGKDPGDLSSLEDPATIEAVSAAR